VQQALPEKNYQTIKKINTSPLAMVERNHKKRNSAQNVEAY
jgi:hypothetical protein